MIWTIHFSETATKKLGKMDRTSLTRIHSFIQNRLKTSENPKNLAKPMSGPLAGLWRFRVGDWRLICEIENHSITILILDIDHRKDIYKKYLL